MSNYAGCRCRPACRTIYAPDPSETEQNRPLSPWSRHLCGSHWLSSVPVAAILAYLAIRPETPGGPLFIYSDGSPLTRDRLIAAVRRALAEAGVDTTGYSGHSFRIGAATAAARAGLGDALIKTLGRWESAAYQRYIRTPRSSLATVSSQIASLP